MKITGIKSYSVKLPSRRVHNWASKMNTPIGHHYLLKVETDEGITGWGESPAIATWGGPHGTYYGEDSNTVRYVVETYLIPALEGEDPRNIGGCHQRMDKAIKGSPYAKAAVDMALYDIAGRAAGVPVYQLLGGALRDHLPICQSLGIMENARAVAEAEEAAAEGVTTIKCKTGLDSERDIDLVAQLRKALGGKIGIRVDGNEGYPSVHEAIRVTRAQEEYGILFCEQPVMGFEALAAVKRGIASPVMADESAWSTRDILRLRELGAADIISLYYTKPGGLYRAKQVADVCQASGISCDIGGSIEMGIGVAANLHLGVSVEALAWASVCPVPNPDGASGNKMAGIYYLDDIITEPLRYENGKLYVPQGPGLGVSVDEEKLAKYSI